MKSAKLYYSISEVSKITLLEQYVLRYWESEFPQIRPKKNRAGNRIYKQSDIAIIQEVKRLLYDEKYTIAGARKHLKTGGLSKNSNTARESGNQLAETKNIMKDVIKGIDDLLLEIQEAKKNEP